MIPKVLWNSLLATPALVGAALLVSSSAMAAEAQRTTGAAALLNDVAAYSGESTGITALASQAVSTQGNAQVSSAQVNTGSAQVNTVASAAPAQQVAPAPTASGAALEAASKAPAPVQLAQVSPEQTASATPSVSSLDQIRQYSNEGNNSLSQVTSITQLSDVRPTDWAYQALQSLVEKYGCIAGYPDGTYKGQRAMTRFEFAAGMNACLDRISELIASSTADLATKEDLATVQRLQEEFAAELATLRGRVDALEARTAELEANQFSTTTKLNGETIFAAGVNIDSDDQKFDADNAIGGYRIRLNFDTSFTGEDLLRARLQAREFDDFDSFGGNVDWQWSSDSPGGGSNTVKIDDLFYTFPLGNRVQVLIGANATGDSDFVASTVSPFDSSGAGSLTTFGTPPQYNFIPGGTGAGAIIQITNGLSLDFGYAASDAGNPSDKSGLFNGDYGAIVQLTYLSNFVDIAAMYANSYSQNGFGSTAGFRLGDYNGVNVSDDGGNANAEIANIYGAQINIKPFDWLQVGGGAMYMPVRVLGQGDYDVWSYQGTVAFPDLFGPGNLLGFVFGVPPRIAGADSSLALDGTARSRRQDAAFIVEGFYRFRLNDNIAITPGITWISDPGNDNSVDDTFVGAIRTTFTF
jgi:hypothetical protein